MSNITNLLLLVLKIVMTHYTKNEVFYVVQKIIEFTINRVIRNFTNKPKEIQDDFPDKTELELEVNYLTICIARCYSGVFDII